MAGRFGAVAQVAYDHEFAGVGGGLRRFAVRQGAPTFGGAVPSKPLELGVGEKDLAVLRRPQDMYAERLRRRSDEGAAMGVPAAVKLRPAVRQAAAPIDVLAGDPFRLDSHRV